MAGAEGSPQLESDQNAEEIFLNGAIRVIRRESDYMAYVGDNTATWDCGATQDEAIGALVRSHPDEIAAALQSEPQE